MKCPSCGSDNTRGFSHFASGRAMNEEQVRRLAERNGDFVACGDCDVTTRTGPSVEKAVQSWRDAGSPAVEYC
jgi:hypothetical protein